MRPGPRRRFASMLSAQSLLYAGGPSSEQDTPTVTVEGATSSTAEFGVTTTTGNAIVVGIALKNGFRVDTLTDNYSNTYTLVGYAENGDTVAELWYAQNIAGGPGHELTANFTGLAYCVWGAVELSGVQASGALDTGSVGTSAAVTTVGSDGRQGIAITSGSLAATKEIIVAMLALGGGGEDADIRKGKAWRTFLLFNDFDGVAAGSGITKMEPKKRPVTATWSAVAEADTPFAAVIAGFFAKAGSDVVLLPPENTAAPVASGTATEGAELSVTNGTWANSPTSYAYQWKRGGVAINGATASTYTLVTADVGANITCTVTATNAAGSAAATSNAIGPIQAALVAPVNTVAPAVSGTARVDHTLTMTNGTWSNSPDSYAYQWLADDVAIDGATSSTFLLTTDEIGALIKARVTATNAAGSTAATSAATAAVEAAITTTVTHVSAEVILRPAPTLYATHVNAEVIRSVAT